MEAQMKSKQKLNHRCRSIALTICVFFNSNIYSNKLNFFLKHADFTLFLLGEKFTKPKYFMTNEGNMTINQVLDTLA